MQGTNWKCPRASSTEDQLGSGHPPFIAQRNEFHSWIFLPELVLYKWFKLVASRLLKDNHLETWIWSNWRIVFSKHCLLLLCKGLIQDKVSEYNVSVHSWMHICVYTDVSRSCKQVVHSWLWAKLTKTSTPCGALMPACLNLASYKYKHTPGKVYISNIFIQLRIYIYMTSTPA